MRFTITLLTLLFGFAVIPQASEAPGDCKTAAETLSAGIGSQPEKALMFFDDAIKSSPECVRILLGTAIKASQANDELLKQMIHVAMTEYPEMQNTIAETAMEMAPDSALAIRDAFVKATAPVVEEAAPKKASPVDRFLEGTGSEEENFSPLVVDASDGVARAIARLSAQVGLEQEVINDSIEFRRPDNIVVADVVTKYDEKTLEDSSPVDTAEEEIEEETVVELVMLDEGVKPHQAPAAVEPAIEEVAVVEVEKAPEPKKEEKAKDEFSERFVSIPANSSIYFIPSAGGPDLASNERNPIVLRSLPVSPTMAQ